MIRLIDAEALKENGTVIAIVNGEKMKVVPVKCIDNAPTVELKNVDGDLISRSKLKEVLKNEIGEHALSVAIDRVIDSI